MQVAEVSLQQKDDKTLKRKSLDSGIEGLERTSCKTQALGLASLKSYIAERQGERDEMQDDHVLLDDCLNEFPQLTSKYRRISFYGVFDGHGGDKASKFSSKRLIQIIKEKIPKAEINQFEKQIKKSLVESFKRLDAEFLNQASMQKPVWKDGTTVCSILVLNDMMYICNLGDSKAVLCRYHQDHKKHVSVALSQDHNPINYEERQRIQKEGGQVREGRIMGILEVSRSIGDGQYKKCGVSNIPDIKRCLLNSNDRFLIIACDGLWKVFRPQDAIEFVLMVVQDSSIKVPENSSKSLEEVRFEAACNKLASEAVRKGSGDNVTVLLLSINKL